MNASSFQLLKRAVGAVALAALLSIPAFAQERATPKAVVKESVRVAPVRAEPDATAALRAEIERCGAACMIGGSGDIAAPGGGTLDYNCDEKGNCACFGASDCVKMSDICKEDTIGCNDQGCICEKGGDGG